MQKKKKKKKITQTRHLTAWTSHDDIHSRQLASWLVAQQANNTIKTLFLKTAESARKLLQIFCINPSDIRTREKHVFTFSLAEVCGENSGGVNT